MKTLLALLLLTSTAFAADYGFSIPAGNGKNPARDLAAGNWVCKSTAQTVWLAGPEGSRWTLTSNAPNGTLTYSRNGVALAVYQSRTANLGTGQATLPLIYLATDAMPQSVTLNPQ